MRALVTGGAGYIGAHLVLDLLLAGHDVTVIDDLSTGHAAALDRVAALAGRGATLVRAGVEDDAALAAALVGVDVVFHLAASKLVNESMVAPERYFRNNLAGLAALLDGMERAGVRRFVYSSSAAVYGAQPAAPIREDAPCAPESPYGLTKLQGEQLLGWMAAQRGWAAISLRYFNPVGAHPSGRIGQPLPEGVALVPRALQALVTGRTLTIFGDDWPTPDGTALRDYVHILDLVRAHRVAVDGLRPGRHAIFNVGTGRPHSVREVLDACARVSGREVPAEVGPRRPGDLCQATADVTRFAEALGFRAEYGLDDMVASAWRWSSENPEGYT
jgi:UDP-glucose 4-epimerase